MTSPRWSEEFVRKVYLEQRYTCVNFQGQNTPDFVGVNENGTRNGIEVTCLRHGYARFASLIHDSFSNVMKAKGEDCIRWGVFCEIYVPAFILPGDKRAESKQEREKETAFIEQCRDEFQRLLNNRIRTESARQERPRADEYNLWLQVPPSRQSVNGSVHVFFHPRHQSYIGPKFQWLHGDNKKNGEQNFEDIDIQRDSPTPAADIVCRMQQAIKNKMEKTKKGVVGVDPFDNFELVIVDLNGVVGKYYSYVSKNVIVPPFFQCVTVVDPTIPHHPLLQLRPKCE